MNIQMSKCDPYREKFLLSEQARREGEGVHMHPPFWGVNNMASM